MDKDLILLPLLGRLATLLRRCLLTLLRGRLLTLLRGLALLGGPPIGETDIGVGASPVSVGLVSFRVNWAVGDTTSLASDKTHTSVSRLGQAVALLAPLCGFRRRDHLGKMH